MERSSRKGQTEGSTIEKWIGSEEKCTKNMEKICKEIEELRKQMEVMHTKMQENFTEQIATIRNELIEERMVRKEERERNDKMWKEEKKQLERKIAELEWINEKRERENRKKNVVIKGVKWETRKIEQKVNKFMKENLDVEETAKKVYKVKIKENKEIVVTELESWEQKREVMSKKKNLKTGIWIEDDLTKEEKEIQKQLRERKSKGRKDKRKEGKSRIYENIYLVIGGNYNARMGNKGGPIRKDKEREKEGESRNSKDKVINKEGRVLIDKIKERRWTILNGSYDNEGGWTYIGGSGVYRLCCGK